MRNDMSGPKRRRHFSFNESVDEGDKTMRMEPTDVQAAVPSDQNEPVEQIEESPPGSPAFEDQ